MMNQVAQHDPSALAAPDAGSQLRLRRLRSQYGMRLATPAPPTSIVDADRLRWIRANRGNFAIVDALEHSDRDADFDAKIDAAMRISLAGRHIHVGLDDLA
jgi:hypothetical protein